MKRLTLMVSGNVQAAGYRDIIIRLGTALGLKGYAENLPDGRVKVVAEGEEKKLELLKESADIKNTLINVEKIESGLSEATGEFSRFYKLVSEGETDERLDRAAELMKELIGAVQKVTGAVQSGFNETVGAIKSVKVDTSAMLEKQDKMLEKQDKSIELLETIKEDTSDMKSTLKDTKSSLSSFIEEKFKMQEIEIAEIKATLARMQAS